MFKLILIFILCLNVFANENYKVLTMEDIDNELVDEEEVVSEANDITEDSEELIIVVSKAEAKQIKDLDYDKINQHIGENLDTYFTKDVKAFHLSGTLANKTFNYSVGTVFSTVKSFFKNIPELVTGNNSFNTVKEYNSTLKIGLESNKTFESTCKTGVEDHFLDHYVTLKINCSKQDEYKKFSKKDIYVEFKYVEDELFDDKNERVPASSN